MYNPYLLLITFLSALTLSFAGIAPLHADTAGNDLSSGMDGFLQWELLSGNAEVSGTESYSGQRSILFEGANGETLLRRELKAGENSPVKTELHILPKVNPEGEMSVDLNGVLLSFAGVEADKLEISYFDGKHWGQIGLFRNASWLKIESVQDYSRGSVVLKLDGGLVAKNLEFTTETSDGYYLKVAGDINSSLYVNALTISLDQPSDSVGSDVDKHEVFDALENQIIDWDEKDAINAVYDVDPDADYDGDGISNAEEFARGTSPTDYYNGQAPILKKVSGDLQQGVPGSYAAEPLVVQVLDASGAPLVNAPVMFEVAKGNAGLSSYVSDQASTHRQLTLRTNAAGLVKYQNPHLHDPDTILFYDDFNGDALDREKWDISALQVGRTEYGKAPQLVVTEEGVGVARFGLDTYNPEHPGKMFHGTSIKTYSEFNQESVIEFEARARLVDTSENRISRGLIGAVSLYNDATRDEIDWSYLSNQLGESKVLTNVYNNGFPMDVGDVEYTEVAGLDISQFNTYTTRWRKDKIEYFLNGKRIRTGPNRGILNDVPEDPLHVYLSLFAPSAGFAKAYDANLQPVNNQSLNESYFYDVDYVQVRAPRLETLHAAGTVPVYLKQGALGESVIMASTVSESEGAQVKFSTVSAYNETPDIRLRDTGDIAVGDQCTISWDAIDKEGDAKIALYCDTDQTGNDGILIAEDLHAASSYKYVWKTQNVEEGNYYIYAVIDDGVNDPVTVYSDRSVYVPDAAYSDNQLSNGSLEFGEEIGRSKIEGWRSFGDVLHYSKQAYTGVYHAKLFGDAGYYQDVATVAGQPWRALAYVQNPSDEPLSGAAFLALGFLDGEGNVLAEYESDQIGSHRSLDEYIPLKVEAIAPENSVLARITLVSKGTGSVYFDEASLCKQVELNNSSFELGEAVGTVNIDHWQHFGETYIYEGSSRSGGWHIAAFGTFPEDGRENYSGCYQEAPAREGELWHASVYALNPSEDPIRNRNEGRLNLVFVDGDGNILPGGENSSESVFSNSLKDRHLLLNVSAYAPPGTASARIAPMLIQRENAKGCICFDDARLYQEPGARNAGFELGDGYGSRLIWGWTPFGEGVYHDHTDPLDGNHHLRLVNEEGDTHTGVHQDFAVIAGEAWRAKAYAGILPEDPLKGDIAAHLGFYYLDGNGDIVGGGELNSNKLDAGSPVGHYIPLAIAGIAPAGAVRLRLVPVVGGSGSGTVFFDRVSIEKVYKSHRDRDDDGLPDLWEQEVIDASERDVLRQRSDIVADEDPDQDGLNNEQEFIWGTHPLVPDTDADGMPDGIEVVNHLDPIDSELILYHFNRSGNRITDHKKRVLYGINPTADTDGDGVSDWVEIFHSFTDALKDEFGEVVTLLEVDGADYRNRAGAWQRQGEVVYARDRRGSLDYIIDIAEAGTYRLEIEGRQHNAYSPESGFELVLSVNGSTLGTQILEATYEQSGTVCFYLPHLGAGEHAVTIEWINGEPQTTLEIIALRLQAIAGNDLDGNGLADWVDTRLANMSALDESRALSAVSPYTLEGTSYTLDQLIIHSDYRPYPDEEPGPILPRQGLIGQYYANIDLNPEEATVIRVQDQGGIAGFEKTVTWVETNITDEDNQRIRKGDRLLLAAFLHDSAPEDAVNIEVAAPDASLETFEIHAGAAVAYRFEQAGVYLVKALINGAERSIEVEVVDAELGANPIVYIGAQDREWSPVAPENVALEQDLHVYLSEVTVDGAARSFALGAGSAQPGAILARLGENGPIMDSAYVEAVVDYRNSNGSWSVTEVFADGSRLVEITIQLSDIPEDLMIELTSIKAGVTFDDGLIRRTVTAADFDALGVYRYRMIIAPGVDGSSCHKVNFYQGDTWIGGNY